ncbi:DUF4226 domain-containing protein [Mycobacterium sp. TY815]|uniref:DUF4226 domain-containing protein n=1 Tax=Mycobacterium sp. TY815 TaxID=3050581 RepID=UPI0027407BE1|nr:DUF4226 domain-containing protein [Mycobacterium sp. TY815]MDP7707391.1 DUF4226 domain-containing protein [Mycobacterium sp. TY815]
MSNEWDVIPSLVGGTLGLLSGNVPDALMGGLAGLLPAVLADDSPAGRPPPYPGSVPGSAPYPGMPAPGSGQHVEVAEAEAKAIAALAKNLAELDQSAKATLDAIHASSETTKRVLDGIQRDVEAKIVELSKQGRLSTPEGQEELRRFLKEKLSAAKQLIEGQIADAESKARATAELTRRYQELTGGSGGSGGKADISDRRGSDGGANQGTSAASATPSEPVAAQPAAAPATPAAATPSSPFGQGMMPGGMSMPTIPSFGGGGLPGLGGGDPLSALSGLAAAGGHGREPNPEDGSAGDGGDRGAREVSKQHGEEGSGDDESSTKLAASRGTGGAAAAEPAATHGAQSGAGDAPDAGGQAPTAHVSLPDGTTADARSAQGATAVKAALNGASVTDAWRQAGVTVPPPGTPVTAPIPPTKLQAGDVGVWKDHLVMALGSGKVLVSGQVQPLTSVGSGPDFLGWTDPSARLGGTGQNAAAAPPATAGGHA